jgi:hypothetical protein
VTQIYFDGFSSQKRQILRSRWRSTLSSRSRLPLPLPRQFVVMRITLDSNAWESIFNEARDDLVPLRAAFAKGHLRGFICASAFRIEAI